MYYVSKTVNDKPKLVAACITREAFVHLINLLDDIEGGLAPLMFFGDSPARDSANDGPEVGIINREAQIRAEEFFN